jgi:CubicO group peptidase (beta-lactamase class C family)
MPYEKFMDERIFKPLGMTDTTFWPTDEQVSRLAKSYKPNAAKNDLEECLVGQLHYPLTDHTVRFPMPAGGLFSTAHDLSQFYRMLLNGGQLDGRRIVSEASLKQMTSKQTPAALKDGYGFGFSASPSGYGHGGAYSTDSHVDVPHGLILIWLVQHAGFPGKGGESKNAFNKAALDAFAPKK